MISIFVSTILLIGMAIIILALTFFIFSVFISLISFILEELDRIQEDKDND